LACQGYLGQLPTAGRGSGAKKTKGGGIVFLKNVTNRGGRGGKSWKKIKTFDIQ